MVARNYPGYCNPWFGISRLLQEEEVKSMEKIKRFFRDEEGVTAIEYGLIAALIAVAIIAATATLGGKIAGTFTTVSGKMP